MNEREWANRERLDWLSGYEEPQEIEIVGVTHEFKCKRFDKEFRNAPAKEFPLQEDRVLSNVNRYKALMCAIIESAVYDRKLRVRRTKRSDSPSTRIKLVQFRRNKKDGKTFLESKALDNIIDECEIDIDITSAREKLNIKTKRGKENEKQKKLQNV